MHEAPWVHVDSERNQVGDGGRCRARRLSLDGPRGRSPCLPERGERSISAVGLLSNDGRARCVGGLRPSRPAQLASGSSNLDAHPSQWRDSLGLGPGWGRRVHDGVRGRGGDIPRRGQLLVVESRTNTGLPVAYYTRTGISLNTVANRFAGGKPTANGEGACTANHTFSSPEWQAAAAIEGFANFYAMSVWNDLGGSPVTACW